jgi:endoglucanase Acf2
MNQLQTLFVIIFLSIANLVSAQVIPAGSGSYTKTFPGTDEAGRNGFPAGTPQLSGAAVGRPVPTNDWWSNLVLNNHADNLFNYPMTMKTVNSGLVVTYIPKGVIDDIQPIVVGVSNLNVSKTTVSDYSDWTVTMNWNNRFKTTSGIGMPFLYFNKEDQEEASITVNTGTVEVSGEMMLITDARNGADFVVYAPTGSSWSQSGSTYTSTLNGKNYWSMVMLPQHTSNISSIAAEYKKYAYVFPSNTTTTWNYDVATSLIRTDFLVETEVKEGTGANVLLGLLPHQWGHLTNDSPQPEGYEYTSIRGKILTLDGNTFSVENTFHGILPTLPYLSNYSEGFDLSALNKKVELLENDQLATWTDSYNEGQVMNRLIQTARIADEMGNLVARNKMIATIKERLEDWLTADGSEVAFLFYYNSDWSAMLGYPAGHGQDNNINDHHFHWGYFIHAAAFLEQFEPGWADQWGPMVNLLIRDAATSDRADDLFPYLRSFSPYAGHSWANGFATFPQGNDQESTSESMQFNSSLIHWGSITGNDAVRDLGIYLYTTEQTAVEEYWFDVNEQIFPENPYALVSRVWGNSYDNGTFWTSDIEASYGIELYPIHGGSMYLGHNISYAEKLWAEIEKNTGILGNDDNVNLWHDTMYKYLSFTDPQKAIDLYNNNPERNIKFGVSDAQTYYWMHAMNAMGQIDISITANYPLAVAFQKDNSYTYAAHNYSETDIEVTFSNGFVLQVPAQSMATNRDIEISGSISSSFASAYPGGSVVLSVNPQGGTPSKVEFYDNGVLIGEDSTDPFTFKAINLSLQVHGFYAKVFVGSDFGVTDITTVTVGEQLAFNEANPIPGTIEAGQYDIYEGGKGQGISYSDVSPNNEGDYRMDEAVDAALSSSEGATVGWISGGEWIKYSVQVASSGYYDLSFRYASGNQNGGGPFHFDLNGERISEDITVGGSGDWDAWQSQTVTDLPIPEGNHILSLVFDQGEFNIGKMTFAFQSDLPYSQPMAHAGEDVIVVLPTTTGRLDGSQSSDKDNDELAFEWQQVYGPSMITFSDPSISSPEISNLEDGVYLCKLIVNDGVYYSTDLVRVIVSETGNSAPSVSIGSPANNETFKQGDEILIKVKATDLEGPVAKVEFFADGTKLGEDTATPFEFEWNGAEIGAHALTTIATDLAGVTAASATVNIIVEEVKSCSIVSSDAQQGAFTIGYKATFETVGTNVIVTFELLDNDKNADVAYLWQESPFTEVSMNKVSEKIFSKTLTGLTTGATISVACKFDVGSVLVTQYLQYQVGSECQETEDTNGPTDFTATLGNVTFNSVELILNGTDDSGTVIYSVAYGADTKTVAVDGGAQEVITVSKLDAEKSYSFSVTASDLNGNQASDNPIVVEATTTQNTNTACLGSNFQAKNGVFDIGYSYAFETNDTEVTVTFELLDDKKDVFAILQQESPFSESQMTHISGRRFSHILANQTKGTSISYACKFAFAGGLAETKYLSYTVGDLCKGETITNVIDQSIEDISVYPNPVDDRLTINCNSFRSVSVISFDGRHIFTSNEKTISLSALKNGIYLVSVLGEAGRKNFKVVKH